MRSKGILALVAAVVFLFVAQAHAATTLTLSTPTRTIPPSPSRP